MDIAALEAALTPRADTLTVTDALLPGVGLGVPLADFCGGQPLVITGAAVHRHGDAEVRVTGTDLLGGTALDQQAFVLATAAGTDHPTGSPLAQGLNVIGYVQPASLLGPFSGPLGANGRVQGPRETATPGWQASPWRCAGGVIPCVS